MGWANASYLPAIVEHLPKGFVAGKQALRFVVQEDELPDEGRIALRRYSTSEFAGQEDGKSLNAALLNGTPGFDAWAEGMDASCVWSFRMDVLLWRGFAVAPEFGEPSHCFISTSLVERQARKFRSQSGAGVAAILLPAGSRVAIPGFVWHTGDDERTLGVVTREVEIILPRGTVLSKEASVEPFVEKRPQSRERVQIYRAEVPEPRPDFSI